MRTIKVGSPEYKRLLRRYNELAHIWTEHEMTIGCGLTPEQLSEMLRTNALLDDAERAHGEARGEAGQ